MPSNYRPINLTSLQIGMESGGQQFDKQGRPLRSPKGATGVAQVMPSTGPEAAKLAGLPWDPKRFENDRDYNMRLGDAYQGMLDKRFGKGTPAALAAYNAGPNRVAKLIKKHGDNWQAHLPAETKKYVRGIMGKAPTSAQGSGSRAARFAMDIAENLGVSMEEFSVDAPRQGEEQATKDMLGIQRPADVDQAGIKAGVAKYQDSTSRYMAFLESAVAPLRENAKEVVNKVAGVAGTKENLANDFAQRANDLQAKLIPLQQRRQAIIDRMAELDGMSGIERRLKSTFNTDYDPRILRGRLERVEMQIEGHQKTYSELNAIRSGVAALQVDAEAADVDELNARSRGVLADAQLLGQVAGAIRTNVDASILPMQMQVETLRLNEAAKQTMLGTMSMEQINKYYQDVQASPNGAIEVDGVKLTVGDLQDANRKAQSQELGLRSLKNSYAQQDFQTASMMEDFIIEHMSPEQVQEALKNGGTYQGQQLSVMKLAQASQAVATVRENQINEIVLNTAEGQAAGMLKSFGGFIKDTGRRSQDMFGNLPQELVGAGQAAAAGITLWRKGYEQAKEQGVEREYIARTSSQLQAYQKSYDDALTNVAKKWGQGKPELQAVADAWLRGNPISGDAATKGLITIARSGLPAGAKLSGPALQALQVARATVREFENPSAAKAGDSMETLLAGNTARKPEELMRLVQERVGRVYADAMTDELLNTLPSLAQNVRDPENPGRPHPFSRVSQADFTRAVRHGDNEGFAAVGRDLGLNAQQTQKMFAEGVDGATWQMVKKAKGFGDGQFAELFQSLQAAQMSGTLQALDATGSARPGFSPARAYIDFLQNQEVLNRVDQTVSQYGKGTFGSFLVSSASGGGYREAWTGYAQTLGAVYTQQSQTELRNAIKQKRSLVGDPFVRFNAVNRAAGLSQRESQMLLEAARPLVHFPGQGLSQAQLLGSRNPAMTRQVTTQGFNAVESVIRNHKFDDPVVEKLRKRVDTQWDAMDALVGTVFDSVND